jgi:hypothetical protein
VKFVRKALSVLVVLFIVFYLVTRPEAAAGSVRTVFDALSTAASSIVTFFTALAG